MVQVSKLFYSLAVFLILLVQHNNFTFGMDGCDSEELWRCGDKCLWSYGVCKCGGKEFGPYDGLWCCKSSQGICTIEEYEYNYAIVVTCHGSQALDLKDQCHTKSSTTSGVCNHYPSDEYRNLYAKRSYLNLCLDER